jgi:hypothetical protein
MFILEMINEILDLGLGNMLQFMGVKGFKKLSQGIFIGFYAGGCIVLEPQFYSKIR